MASVPVPWGAECGGEGGVPYRTFAYAPARIQRVTIEYRQYVDGIQLETDQGILPKIGNPKKHRDLHEEQFELEPDEFLTGITVECWHYLDRITFHTNKRTQGPYGGAGGRLKKTLMAPPGRMVVGFTGRHWEFVDSIRLIVQ